ncbi:MAG: NADH-quinone oxidoreductase subunit NuoF [bacterium]|jgi:NADH-quinone oxidoreductase subunit F|nr:NADH-quinone oxidoreductase subunit NuoF [bacterium]
MADFICFPALQSKSRASLDDYLADGGYRSLKKALDGIAPADLVQLVRSSGLRGRGGAGFPTGMKWGFLPKQGGQPVYLVCNADEGEPGTFKDRDILRHAPHQLIEGMVLTCHAIGARVGYIYIRGEFREEAAAVERALAEARGAGLLGRDILGRGLDVELHAHMGAGAYICGEETALLNSLEGRRGLPRTKPPFPAVVGLYGCPTIINNVETLAAVPPIVQHGAEWYVSLGTEKSPGTKLFSVSGHVERPGVYELRMGTPLMDLINVDCGGMKGGRALKAVIPGGSSVPMITAAEAASLRLDYESCLEHGTMLGSGAVIVLDETVSIPHAVQNLAHFYAHESCGQCTPCREGTHWMHKILDRLIEGKGQASDLDLLLDICRHISFRTICALGDAATGPVKSGVMKFRSEFEALVR